MGKFAFKVEGGRGSRAILNEFKIGFLVQSVSDLRAIFIDQLKAQGGHSTSKSTGRLCRGRKNEAPRASGAGSPRSRLGSRPRRDTGR